MSKQIFTLVTVAFTLFVLNGCAPKDPLSPEDKTITISSGTIGTGGSLSDVLGQTGALPPDQMKIQTALKPYVNPRRVKPSDRYEIWRSSGGLFVRLVYWPTPFEFYTVAPSSGNVFTATASTVPLQESVAGVSGRIEVSLWEAMSSQGISPEMIYNYADIFGWRVDFLTEPRTGDTYKMVWKRATSSNAVRDGDILYALYQGKETGLVYAFLLDNEYYDDKGTSLRGEFLRAPLAFRRISSRFTNARFHPVLRYYRPHHGIDYAAARGTPVVAIGDGTVIVKGYHRGLGNEVRIRHAGSFVSIYGHLMGFARGLRRGASVRQGQLIGYVGSTGLSTGPHLHFGMEHAGRLVNFLAMKSSQKRRSVLSADRDRYRDVKKEGFRLFSQLPPTAEPFVILKQESK